MVGRDNIVSWLARQETKRQKEVYILGQVTREDLELESGLADDFDGAIVEARFGVREEYAAIAGVADPMIMLTIESPELPQPIEQGWSCGAAKKWEAGVGGKNIVSGAKPDSKKFNVNARAGALVMRMFELVGNGNREKGQEFFLKRGYPMTDAQFYMGLDYHWKREPMSTVSGESRDVLMPNAYLGEVKAKAAKAATEKGEYAPELVDKLVELAEGRTARELKSEAVKTLDKSATGYAAFIKAVVSGEVIEELKAQDKLIEGPDSKFV